MRRMSEDTLMNIVLVTLCCVLTSAFTVAFSLMLVEATPGALNGNSPEDFMFIVFLLALDLVAIGAVVEIMNKGLAIIQRSVISDEENYARSCREETNKRDDS